MKEQVTIKIQRESRGIRNNNPFNIKRSSSRWLGKVPHKDSTDNVFEQFTDLDFGLRAGIVLLHGYLKRGFDTPREILTRFAPSFENDTDSYLRFVCGSLLEFDFHYAYKSLGFFLICQRICMYESRYFLSSDYYSTILHKFNL